MYLCMVFFTVSLPYTIKNKFIFQTGKSGIRKDTFDKCAGTKPDCGYSMADIVTGKYAIICDKMSLVATLGKDFRYFFYF